MAQGTAQWLRIRLLGNPHWTSDLGAGPLQAKFAALVACVAVGGRQARDAVARQLWPGDLDRARDNLRQHVTRLRKLTLHAVFLQDESIELAPGVDCDVFGRPTDWSLPELLADRTFLAGLEYPGLSGLKAWIELQREHWSGLAGEALVQRSAQMERADEPAQALSLAGRATEVAPWLESAWRARMRLHYLAADHAAAAHAFTRLQEHLSRVHALPSGETLALWRTIERGGSAPARPAALPASLLRPPLLIGRERQWAAMQAAWQTRRPFLLKGEAGIGKSRLLFDFVRQHGPAVVVSGRKGDEHAPYSTLGSLLRVLIEQQGLTPKVEVRRDLARLLPGSAAAPDDGPVEQRRLWQAVAVLLHQAAESGVRAIALDDLHFADTASLEACRWLTAGPSAQWLNFAFSTRPMTEGRQAALLEDWLTDSARPVVVGLEPLTPEELARLFDTLDLPPGPTIVAIEDLFAHAGGQPFLVLETLKELALRPASAQGSALPSPPNAAPLLQRRLLSLPAHALPLLQLAAVLGVDIHRASLALGRPAVESMAMAAALEAHGVVRDGHIVHDLMRSTVLERMPEDERRSCHAVAAAALAADPHVPHARTAMHWAAAQQWPKAALAFRAAGRAARDAGRLPESSGLFQQAASCSRREGDTIGEFEAVYEEYEANCDRLGPTEAEQFVLRMQALASIPEQQARTAIAAAHVAITRFDRGPDLLVRTTLAVERSGPFEHLRSDALNLHGMVLAQSARFDEAIDACRQAVQLASMGGQQRKARERSTDLAYVYYAASRIGDAIDINRRLVDTFEKAGDVASAGQVESNLATLLLLSGDPEASLVPAQHARQSLHAMQAGAASSLVVLNAATLGSALSYRGRFDEALGLLTESVATAEGGATAPRMKVQLALAHVWLLLGASTEALAALGSDDMAWPEAFRSPLCWAQVRAALIEGRPAPDALAEIGRLRRENWAAPLSQSPWLEWSRQGDAAEVAEQMDRVRDLYHRAGMPGAARAAVLRRIDRLGEIDDPTARLTAAALARELRPEVSKGLHASTYLPEAWSILATALAHAGDARLAAECRDEARHWIQHVALPNVPDAWKESFLQRNPINRALLQAD